MAWPEESEQWVFLCFAFVFVVTGLFVGMPLWHQWLG